MIRMTGAHGRAKLILFALMLVGFGVGPGAVTNAFAETVTAVTPLTSSTGVCLGSAVTVQLSNGVNPNTADSNASQRFNLTGPGSVQVPAHYNTDGAYSNVTLQPDADLAPNTTYTVHVTSSLMSPGGTPYTPFTSTFTTGSSACAPHANVSFTPSILDANGTTGPTALALGPDPNHPTQLWAGFGSGTIRVYNLDPATGQATGAPTISTTNPAGSTFRFNRVISAIRFDPSSTAGNIKLWVSNGQPNCDYAASGFMTPCYDFTGALSTLTGSSALSMTRTDVVTGLPRSVGNHMNNGFDFGPDGAIYLAQGANNGYGAPDGIWGNRPDVPLTAAILRIDVNGITSPPYNVSTQSADPGGLDPAAPPTPDYDPTAAGAKVTRYATGTRNPYSVLWHSNGRLYAPVNESANGNTPAGSGCPVLSNGTQAGLLPAFDDYFTQIVQGKYYGHPNPSRGEYCLNGGNPTNGVDPFEVPQYPVPTLPNSNWRKPDLDLGLHRSADGSAEYKSGVFGANLQGQILVTEYSQGKDIIAVKLDANGNAVSTSVVASGLFNPLPIVTDNATGRIYVGEYGQDPSGVGGKVTLLTPNPPPSGGGSKTVTPCKKKSSLKITLKNSKHWRYTKLVVYVNGKKRKTVKSSKLGRGKKTKSFTITGLPTTKNSKIKILGSRNHGKKRTTNKTFKPSC